MGKCLSYAVKIAQISNFNYHLQLVSKESENKLKMIAIAVRDWFIERHRETSALGENILQASLLMLRNFF
jgi:hypothetical protein